MLTGQGWLLAAVAAVAIAAGRILGSVELYVLGAVAFATLLCSVTYVTLRRVRMNVQRSLHPARAHQHSPCHVTLEVRNTAKRSSPLLDIRESVGPNGLALLPVPPLRSDGEMSVGYELDTSRRGIVEIGPMVVVLSDPLRLAASRMAAAGVEQVTIFPEMHPIPAVPQTTGNDPLAGAEHPNAMGHGGEDFYALRAYVVGDDLRRVHWPSTARHDDLMVRQDEVPWQGRVTVLLDNRKHVHTDHSFESAVSAAASLLDASVRRQDLVRLVTTEGSDSGVAAGQSHNQAILEQLAMVQVSHDAVYKRVIGRLSRSTGAGALLVLTSDRAESGDLHRFLSLRSRFSPTRVVRFATEELATAEQIRALAPGDRSPAIYDATDARSFAAAWTRQFGARGMVRTTNTRAPAAESLIADLAGETVV